MVYNLYIHQNVWINRNITAPSDTSDPPSTVCRACLRSPRHGGTHNYSSRSLHTSIRIGFYISLFYCTHRSWWCLPRTAGWRAAGCPCRRWSWRPGSRRRAARNWRWSGRSEADTGQHTRSIQNTTPHSPWHCPHRTNEGYSFRESSSVTALQFLSITVSALYLWN